MEEFISYIKKKEKSAKWIGIALISAVAIYMGARLYASSVELKRNRLMIKYYKKQLEKE